MIHPSHYSTLCHAFPIQTVTQAITPLVASRFPLIASDRVGPVHRSDLARPPRTTSPAAEKYCPDRSVRFQQHPEQLSDRTAKPVGPAATISRNSSPGPQLLAPFCAWHHVPDSEGGIGEGGIGEGGEGEGGEGGAGGAGGA